MVKYIVTVADPDNTIDVEISDTKTVADLIEHFRKTVWLNQPFDLKEKYNYHGYPKRGFVVRDKDGDIVSLRSQIHCCYYKIQFK